MMKLWIIIYTAGHIGGFAGPLPYDMSQCELRRDEMRAMQVDSLIRGTSDETGLPLRDEQKAGILSLSFECEAREAPPVLGGQ